MNNEKIYKKYEISNVSENDKNRRVAAKFFGDVEMLDQNGDVEIFSA